MQIPTYTIKPLHLGELTGYEKSMHTYRIDYGVKLDSPFMAFLVQGDGRNILVDTGPKDMERVKKYHGHIQANLPEEKTLIKLLAGQNLVPEDIDFIICTHLHWDHCQNNDCFPGKKVYVQKREVRYAIDPLKAHYSTYEAPAAGLVPIWAVAGNQLEIIDGDMEIVPGIDVFLTPGHTPGSQCVRINTADGLYLIAGDTINLYENWIGNGQDDHILSGIHVDLAAFEASYAKLDKMEFKEVIPSHDMKVLEHAVYPYK